MGEFECEINTEKESEINRAEKNDAALDANVNQK